MSGHVWKFRASCDTAQPSLESPGRQIATGTVRPSASLESSLVKVWRKVGHSRQGLRPRKLGADSRLCPKVTLGEYEAFLLRCEIEDLQDEMQRRVDKRK